MSLRSMVGWNSKSNSAIVLRNGNRANRKPGRQPPIPGHGCLVRDEPCEVLDVGPVVGAGLFGERGEDLAGTVQLEVAEIVFDLLIQPDGTHAMVPSS